MASGEPERRWRVTMALRVPRSVSLPPGGSLPERLDFESRMFEQAVDYGDVVLAVRKPTSGKYQDLYGASPQIEVVELVAELWAADTVHSAMERLGPTVETVLDLLSFEMGVALGLGQVQALDVTPPVSLGEERTMGLFASAPFDRSARSVEMQAIQGQLLGRLPAVTDIRDSKTSAVLRWFVKSLGTDVLHDQFIFLWIALEILVDRSEVRVDEPYVGRCGHEIVSCPACGEPTTRMVRGATMRAFLEAFGLEAQVAKDLWRMRQLMHGAIPFDSDKLSSLAALVQPLRAVVAAGLKTALGKGPDAAPIVAASGLSIHPSLEASGTAVVGDDDLRPLL